MPDRSLTALLDKYHDKLDQHTTEIHAIEAKVDGLVDDVAALEAKLATDDQASGARAGLRDWLKSVVELM